MTNRDHRAEAERLLGDADAWGLQAEEPSPALGELICLAYSVTHALLAIHDALTAADRYATNEAKQREEAEPDPLDENDHRDRITGDGYRLTRHGPRHWHWGSPVRCPVAHEAGLTSLGWWDATRGPLAFAPDAAQEAAGGDLSALEGESGAEEGGEPHGRNLNVQTGHERVRLTAQLRQVISSVQDSGDLAELDALADAWEEQ